MVVINNDARGGISLSQTVGTLRANSHGNHPMVSVSAVLTPDREEKRQNGRRVKEPDEPMFTLTAQDKHGAMVSYDRKNGIREKLDVAHTLSASDWRGLNRNQTQNAVLVKGENNAQSAKTNSRKILPELQCEVREKTFRKSSGRFKCIQTSEILRKRMHENSLVKDERKTVTISTEQACNCTTNKPTYSPNNRVSVVWVGKEVGCSPQRRKSIKQFRRNLMDFMSELSHETTQKEENVQDLRSSSERSRTVRETSPTDEEIRRSDDFLGQKSVRIRKLTPLECWRLQGREDWEFQRAKDAGVSDTQLYKQAGNSLVPQIVTAIVKEMES